MPNCRNCGSFVTDDYVRVFGDRSGEIRVCPHCEDRIRDYKEPGGFRETHAPRSSKSNGANPSSYDPDFARADGGGA